MNNSGCSDPRSLFMDQIDSRILSALWPSQVGFIILIRSMEPRIIEEPLRKLIVEMFPPAKLFSTKVLDLASGNME